MERSGHTSGSSWIARILALALAASGTLAASGCTSSGGLLPQDNAQTSTNFTSYDQVVDAFEQIAPGSTRTDDLAHLGFDARQGNVEVLSYLGIENRFMPHSSFQFDRLDPAVKACIQSENSCTGYVFHPERTTTKRVGSVFMDAMGFERVTRSEHWSAEIVILVNNGTVTHKVFSGSPNTKNIEDKEQPLGPLQDVGNALLRGASIAGY